MKIGAIVLAAGYGSCRSVGGSPYPKMIEDIDGRPLIAHTLSRVQPDDFPVRVVVVNPNYELAIRRALQTAGVDDCWFVSQPVRSGAAAAVLCAIPVLEERGINHAVVVFGDMPLWHPATIRRLAAVHRQERPAVISMVTVSLLRGRRPPEFDHYGRIIRNDNNGRIERIVEPADATAGLIRISDSVNPSLYAFDLDWFKGAASTLEPRESPDGLHPEIYIPPLVGIARAQGECVVEVRLEDPEEAIGVNTAEDLEHVRRIMRERSRSQ